MVDDPEHDTDLCRVFSHLHGIWKDGSRQRHRRAAARLMLDMFSDEYRSSVGRHLDLRGLRRYKSRRT